MVFSDEDKILIKSLYLKEHIAKRLTDKSPNKSWTKHGANKLLKKLRDTGTVDRWKAAADHAVKRKLLCLRMLTQKHNN